MMGRPFVYYDDGQEALGRFYLELGEIDLIYREIFLLFRPKRGLSVRLHYKSHQKSSKCQNFLWVWHLVIFRADQSKKPPCRIYALRKNEIF